MKFAASFARGIKRFRGPDVAPTPTLVLNNLLHLDPHCHCYMSKSFSCPLHLGVPMHDKNNIPQFYFLHFSLSPIRNIPEYFQNTFCCVRRAQNNYFLFYAMHRCQNAFVCFVLPLAGHYTYFFHI